MGTCKIYATVTTLPAVAITGPEVRLTATDTAETAAVCRGQSVRTPNHLTRGPNAVSGLKPRS